MIERHWRGLAKKERAEDYIQHLRQETFPHLGTIAGFSGATLLRRSLAQGVEFIVITRWASYEAIHAFAGSDPTLAVVPPAAASMMVEYDNRARHYEVLTQISAP